MGRPLHGRTNNWKPIETDVICISRVWKMRTHPVILKAVTVDRIVNRKRDPCAVDSRPVLRRAGVRGDPRPVSNLLLLITVDNRRLHGRVKSLQLLITASVLRILPAVDVRLPPGPQHRLNQLRVLLTDEAAVFRTKLTFRPHSTDSFTHRKMTLSLADRSSKTSAIKILGTVGSDPDAHRGEMIKKEEERLRASMRRESKQKRIRERSTTGRGMSGNYLEPDRDGYDD